jgi:hypothetical protein
MAFNDQKIKNAMKETKEMKEIDPLQDIELMSCTICVKRSD